MTDRCHRCDKPIAAEDETPGPDQCWALHVGCQGPSVDWRARALAAESTIVAFQLAYLDETHGDRDPATVTPGDVRGLREAFAEAGAAIRSMVPVLDAADRFYDSHGNLLENRALIMAVAAQRKGKGV